MDQGHKHFSHLHNLIIHHMPKGAQVSCSGCHSPATGTVYVCWQCNFFLHDQCYRATRSLKHPSHPPHSLTLVPYPTYPSNSYYCNSCQIAGTGFSYSCADCEFDLHVRCAYSVSGHQTPPNSIPHVQYYSTPHDHAYGNPYTPTAQNPSNSTPSNSIIHFSHPHNLSIMNLIKENNVVCSGCEDIITGKGYSCVEPYCNFQLHESCFHLKREIHHKSHPAHPLNLVLCDKNREFTCNACFNNGRGFTYCCLICKYDLHIQCVNLPETVKRADHEHTLKLTYSSPVKGEGYTVSCDVCYETVENDSWKYHCESCDFDTHLGCVHSEKRVRDNFLETQLELQRLQMEMQMGQQLAQMIANSGASINSLAPDYHYKWEWK